MIQYFNEVLIHKNYVSTSFRKYSLKNGEDTEFSFQIKPPAAKTDGDEQLLNRELDSAFFTQEDFVKLIDFSRLWPLHLADVSIKGSRLIFKLNQQQALCRVLKSILNEQANYGVNFTIPQI
ncbi:UNVERIFIED_CONTAM: hypothetical protein PYX00_007675 [Menopon gallinae]|uniref:Uncharacterized protein n=1 Tax=Menopon gallinae TaxID=328185 RepID=A0AAW2HJX6_9NEOP